MAQKRNTTSSGGSKNGSDSASETRTRKKTSSANGTGGKKSTGGKGRSTGSGKTGKSTNGKKTGTASNKSKTRKGSGSGDSGRGKNGQQNKTLEVNVPRRSQQKRVKDVDGYFQGEDDSRMDNALVLDQKEGHYRHYKRRSLMKDMHLYFLFLVYLILFLANLGAIGTFGDILSGIMFGVMGTLAFIFPIVLTAGTGFYLWQKHFKHEERAVYKQGQFWGIILFMVCICFFTSLVGHSTGDGTMSLTEHFTNSQTTKTGGGFLGGVLVTFIVPYLGKVGAYLIDFVLLIISLTLYTSKTPFEWLPEEYREMVIDYFNGVSPDDDQYLDEEEYYDDDYDDDYDDRGDYDDYDDYYDGEEYYDDDYDNDYRDNRPSSKRKKIAPAVPANADPPQKKEQEKSSIDQGKMTLTDMNFMDDDADKAPDSYKLQTWDSYEDTLRKKNKKEEPKTSQDNESGKDNGPDVTKPVRKRKNKKESEYPDSSRNSSPSHGRLYDSDEEDAFDNSSYGNISGSRAKNPIPSSMNTQSFRDTLDPNLFEITPEDQQDLFLSDEMGEISSSTFPENPSDDFDGTEDSLSNSSQKKRRGSGRKDSLKGDHSSGDRKASEQPYHIDTSSYQGMTEYQPPQKKNQEEVSDDFSDVTEEADDLFADDSDEEYSVNDELSEEEIFESEIGGDYSDIFGGHAAGRRGGLMKEIRPQSREKEDSSGIDLSEKVGRRGGINLSEKGRKRGGINLSEEFETPDEDELSEEFGTTDEEDLSDDFEMSDGEDLSEEFEMPDEEDLSEEFETPDEEDLSDDFEMSDGEDLSEEFEMSDGEDLSGDFEGSGTINRSGQSGIGNRTRASGSGWKVEHLEEDSETSLEEEELPETPRMQKVRSHWQRTKKKVSDDDDDDDEDYVGNEYLNDEYSNEEYADEEYSDEEYSDEEYSSTSSVTSAGPKGKSTSRPGRATEADVSAVKQQIEQKEEARPQRKYIFPDISLLDQPKNVRPGTTGDELMETKRKLQETLDVFGVDATVVGQSCGPAVTRFEIKPGAGVKVSRIVGLTDDIKLALAAADIRIEAPIPGKSAVGIEVPNATSAMVSFRELVQSEFFKKAESRIAFAVGKDIAGKVVVADIAKMPHLLIAGATGSGKSVCINTIIMSILYKAKPDEVKMIMIDPKVVELSVYNGIPHLLIPVVTDPKKAAGALQWAVQEMTDRYNKFAEAGVRDIKGYNAKVERTAGSEDEKKKLRMYKIVIIVDELADLMMVASKDVEESICRLAQLARACGIHLIIATQRPSVNVITGLIKANMPSRIAFAVTSGIDSRTILDMNGAEKLLGKGDMLFSPQGAPKPHRIQGAFVSDDEVSRVVSDIKEKNPMSEETKEKNKGVLKDVELKANSSVSAGPGNEADNGGDPYFAEAGKIICDKEKASIGMLQRYLKVGFNRAARLMDALEDAGVVGPEEGTKPRTVLMTLEQFENYLEENS